MPLVIEPVEDDYAGGDGILRKRKGKSKATKIELDVAVVERGSDAYEEFDNEPGTTTFYGCRLCASLVPTTAEGVAWTHVFRSHGRASLPTDDDIFAVRWPLAIESE